MFNVVLQVINLKRQENKIIKLTEVLETAPYSPENIDEQNIISKYERLNRKQVLAFVILVMSGSPCYFIGNIIKADVPVFPYDIWTPYDLSNPYYYWTTLFFYTSAGFLCAIIGVQFVAFFSSAAMVIQSQVGLLISRFKKSMEIIKQKCNNTNENQDIINDIFSIDIFMFYSTSTVMICTNAYVASTVPLLSHEFFSTVFLCVAVTYAIITICNSSNDMSTAFEELHQIITSANWKILSEKTKKSLMIVMTKTQKPFDFTTGKIIKPSRESLKNIAQVVYSLYNLMRESAKSKHN
ncbi:odorant receptor 4-like [Aphidius gifuensis]|uniref:odorant receptor 4-like n=1 Tax=Aphidius gifuensis TaxID=684658 RepID=UPI001CDD636F|nr:odorant receptor 4-like [Aphidius gifuensis]